MTRTTIEVPDDVAERMNAAATEQLVGEVAAAAAMRLHPRDARSGTETQDVEVRRSAADDLGGVGR